MRLPARASRPSRSSAAWRSAASIRRRGRRESSTSVVLKARCERGLELALGVRGIELGAGDRRSTRPGRTRWRERRAPPEAIGTERKADQCAALVRPRSGCRAARRRGVERFGVTGTGSSLRGVRNGGLLGLERALRPRDCFVVEPVRTRGHDDLVALLVAQAVIAEHPALVLGARTLGSGRRRGSARFSERVRRWQGRQDRRAS